MHPKLCRIFTAPLAGLILLLVLIFSTLPAAADWPSDPTSGPHTADVVIDFGDGRALTRRVSFAEPSISGLQALRLTGLQLTTADFGYGSAVCAVEGVGCPASNCFCQSNRFWGYFYWDGVVWQGHAAGASASMVVDQAVEGWVWGDEHSALPDVITRPLLAANAALQWLRPQQNTNGSFGNNVGATLDVILSVASANQRPEAWRSSSGISLLDYIRPRVSTYAGQSAAAAGKLALGIAAADQDPRSFGGVDLVARLHAVYVPATGAFGVNTMDQSWAMLGLAASGAPVPAAAVQRLASQANADGGWGWAAGVASDVDSTALAVQALRAAGAAPTAPAIVAALDYLHSVQQTNDNGGFAASPAQPWGVDSNTNSTVFAVQGILAAGQDPLSATWSITHTTPITFLLGQQLPSGAFVYVAPPADLFATQQVAPGLMGKPFPLLSRAVALRQGVAWMATQQQPDGSFAGFNPGATIDAVLALVAAGRNPNDFAVNGQTPLSYLATQAGNYTGQGAAAAGKLLVGVAAARANPLSFGGIDLVAALQSTYQPASGQYGAGSTWDQAWALLGLDAVRQPAPAAAVQRLLAIASSGGGWGYSANAAAADVDSTALALQALAASGVAIDHAAVRAGFAFLRTVQNGDGGFPGYSGDTDAASTGLGLQALAAYGINPRGLGWVATVTDGSASALTLHTPVDSLLALQTPAGGFPGYAGADDPMSTYQALQGLAARALPLRAPSPVFLPLVTRR